MGSEKPKVGETPATPAGPPPSGVPLKAGAELEFDIIAPRLNEPAYIDENNESIIDVNESVMTSDKDDDAYSDIDLKVKTKRNRRRKLGHVDVDGGYPLDALNDQPDLNYHASMHKGGSSGDSMSDPYDKKFFRSLNKLSLSDGFNVDEHDEHTNSSKLLDTIIDSKQDQEQIDFSHSANVSDDFSALVNYLSENKNIKRAGRLPGMTTLELLEITQIKKNANNNK